MPKEELRSYHTYAYLVLDQCMLECWNFVLLLRELLPCLFPMYILFAPV